LEDLQGPKDKASLYKLWVYDDDLRANGATSLTS
jgi:hypothetical protein